MRALFRNSHLLPLFLRDHPSPTVTRSTIHPPDTETAKLKPFYIDYSTELPPSPNKSAVRGLNLLFLLVENRLAEFHSELELMGDEERAEPCVVFPVRLEQYLMVGSYDQVRAGFNRLPAEVRRSVNVEIVRERRMGERTCHPRLSSFTRGRWPDVPSTVRSRGIDWGR